MIFRSESLTDTRALGARMARAIVARRPSPRAIAVLLYGDLGSGKTTFMQGVFRELGAGRAVSPTFIIARRRALRRGPFANIYHVDAYRLDPTAALDTIGLDEALFDPKSLVFIEWADRIRSPLLRNAVRVRFRHGKREHERRIVIENMELPPRS